MDILPVMQLCGRVSIENTEREGDNLSGKEIRFSDLTAEEKMEYYTARDRNKYNIRRCESIITSLNRQLRDTDAFTDEWESIFQKLENLRDAITKLRKDERNLSMAYNAVTNTFYPDYMESITNK